MINDHTYCSCAVGLIHCPALLRPLAITDLDLRPVALPHGVPDGLLAKGDLTRLFKVLLALLLLGGAELGDVGVVALLDIPVGALQHWLLRQALHRVLLDHAESPVCCPRRLAKVDTTLVIPSSIPDIGIVCLFLLSFRLELNHV